MAAKFLWDNLSFEIACNEEGSDMSELGWTLTRTYPNGVKRFESDRGHIGLEVEAHDRAHANELFAEHCEEYVEEMRGMEI